jgi:hypothetical protein
MSVVHDKQTSMNMGSLSNPMTFTSHHQALLPTPLAFAKAPQTLPLKRIEPWQILTVFMTNAMLTENKIHIVASHGCLTPVILATQEAEIRRIVVQSQAWANSS